MLHEVKVRGGSAPRDNSLLDDLRAIRRDLAVAKWITLANIAVLAAIFVKLFLG